MRGVERDLDKYADKRIKELYRQTVLAAKGGNRDATKAFGNRALTPRKTTSEKHLDFDSQLNFRQTDNFEVLRQFIGAGNGKERQPPAPLQQKPASKHQRQCN